MQSQDGGALAGEEEYLPPPAGAWPLSSLFPSFFSTELRLDTSTNVVLEPT